MSLFDDTFVTGRIVTDDGAIVSPPACRRASS